MAYTAITKTSLYSVAGVDSCPQSNNCESNSRQMTRLAGHQMRAYYYWASIAREKVCFSRLSCIKVIRSLNLFLKSFHAVFTNPLAL